VVNKWSRPEEVVREQGLHSRPRLFAGPANPSDVCQVCPKIKATLQGTVMGYGCQPFCTPHVPACCCQWMDFMCFGYIFSYGTGGSSPL
jgi:hypothetical protein